MTKGEQNRVVAWSLKIIRQASELPRGVAQTCRHFGLSRKTFHNWRVRYKSHGDAGLCDRPRAPLHFPRATPRTVIDNGAEFQSNFHWHLEQQDVRHVYIRPKTPRLNGKVERSHRVDEQEFYQLLDKDGIGDDIHLFNDKLREWEDYYNYHRPHGALDGQTPYERLLARKASARVLPKP